MIKLIAYAVIRQYKNDISLGSLIIGITVSVLCDQNVKNKNHVTFRVVCTEKAEVVYCEFSNVATLGLS